MPTTEKRPTILIPITLPTIKLGQQLDSIVPGTLRKHELRLRDGDVICVASKVVSIAENRIIPLEHKQISNAARRLAAKYSMNRHLTQIVLEEADSIMGGVRGFLLTIKQGILTANAGVDVKNSPTGTATLWPAHPDNSASSLRASLMRHENVRIGVVIVDSRVTPLRLGTVGIAIGLSGFRAIRDDRGKRDLYGRRVVVTQSNLADDLASAAHLVMGERDERNGLVVIRNAPVTMADGPPTKLTFDPKKCLIASNLRSSQSVRLKP